MLAVCYHDKLEHIFFTLKLIPVLTFCHLLSAIENLSLSHDGRNRKFLRGNHQLPLVTIITYSYVNFVARETPCHCHLNPFSHDKLMQWKPEVTFHFFTSHLRDFKAAILTHFQQNSHKKLKKLHFTKVQNKLISFVFIFYAFKVKHKTRENSNSRNRIRIAVALLLISRSSILKFVASILRPHP